MSFGIPELLIVLVIVVLLFGTTRLKSLGGDLGTAIKGFRNALGSEDKKDDEAKLLADEPNPNTVNRQVDEPAGVSSSESKKDS